MDSWFTWEDPATEYCYLPVARLQQAVTNARTLDLLISTLGVAGKPEYLKRLPIEEKKEALAKEIAHRKVQKTSQWHKHKELEILAGELWKADLPAATRTALWPAVKKEVDLLRPVALFLQTQGMTTFKEVPTGKNRVDVLGYKKGGWFSSERFVAVELKNDLAEFKRGIDQLTTYSDYSHATFLACTPHLAAQYLWSHMDSRGVTKWDAKVLEAKLDKIGAGLLLVDGDNVRVSVEPDERSSPKKLGELQQYLTAKFMV